MSSYRDMMQWRLNCHIRYRQNVDLWHFDLKTNDGDIRGSANCSFSKFPEVDEQFAAIFRKIGATLFFYPCTIWILNLWTLTPLNIRTARCIWKINYIFGLLESRRLIWYTLKQHLSTFNFWPHYNPMGSFWSPLFQNAQWYQRGISWFLYQDM